MNKIHQHKKIFYKKEIKSIFNYNSNNSNTDKKSEQEDISITDKKSDQEDITDKKSEQEDISITDKKSEQEDISITDKKSEQEDISIKDKKSDQEDISITDKKIEEEEISIVVNVCNIYKYNNDKQNERLDMALSLLYELYNDLCKL